MKLNDMYPIPGKYGTRFVTAIDDDRNILIGIADEEGMIAQLELPVEAAKVLSESLADTVKTAESRETCQKAEVNIMQKASNTIH